MREGAIVLEKAYGQRELAPDAPVQADTAFEIGSTSKQFVSALVLLLAEDKKLSIDDPVAKYFPDLTRARDITLYDLMTHASGYRDDYPFDFVDQEMRQPVTPDEAIARYARRPLDFEPRTRWSYSSTGYKILARVVEKVTGKPFGTVLEERVLRPAGMTHSSYMPDVGTLGIARGYTSFAMGPPEPAEPEGRGWVYGGGGLHAPAGDIARSSSGLHIFSPSYLANDQDFANAKSSRQPGTCGRSPGWMNPCFCHAVPKRTVRASSVGRGPSSCVRVAVHPWNQRADEHGSMRGAPLVTRWCFL